MSAEILELEPREMWKHFAALNAVPRPSKKEERVIAFMKSFGENLGLETVVDHIGNVIIKKPATPGMEDRVTIVMQSHLDMVHQKNSDTDFDFDTQGIEMYIDGDWVRAKGTTLGADNGIGVASIMAILESNEIEHPAIEALFTIDEETGMTGAMELKGGMLTGGIMLNLDTEEDDEITIGCAGGIDVTATGAYTQESPGREDLGFKISVTGLMGGHSGGDIHIGRGNANKIMNRLLFLGSEQFGLRIASINGGSLRNAIPRESFAEVSVPGDKADAFKAYVEAQAAIYKAEYTHTDPDLTISLEETETPSSVAASAFQNKFLRAVYACPNGVYRMSPVMEGLTQTSNNLALVQVSEGSFQVQCLTRSAIESEKMDFARAIRATFELVGATVELSGAYPGWTPKPDAPIIQRMVELYQEMYNDKPHVLATHGGLECGLLGQNYPEMEMVSFGPTIRGAHSPDERASISSIQKYWGFLIETLKRIPKK